MLLTWVFVSRIKMIYCSAFPWLNRCVLSPLVPNKLVHKHKKEPTQTGTPQTQKGTPTNRDTDTKRNKIHGPTLYLNVGMFGRNGLFKSVWPYALPRHTHTPTIDMEQKPQTTQINLHNKILYNNFRPHFLSLSRWLLLRKIRGSVFLSIEKLYLFLFQLKFCYDKLFSDLLILIITKVGTKSSCTLCVFREYLPQFYCNLRFFFCYEFLRI